MRKQNNAINPPSEDIYSHDAILMRMRSEKIKKVTSRTMKNGIGGATDVVTGEVFVPFGKTSKERLVRFHEALHAQHTPPRSRPKDILDQALEDARLHRYKSKALTSPYVRARRDELSVALWDLHDIQNKIRNRHPLNAYVSVVALRSYAILDSAPINKRHQSLLSSVLSALGPHAAKDMKQAIDILKNSNGRTDGPEWIEARKIVGAYFDNTDNTFEPEPNPNCSNGDGEREEGDELDSPRSRECNRESESGDAPSDDMSKESEDENRGKSDKSEDKSEKRQEPKNIPPILATRPKSKKKKPDEYQGDLAPACDREQYDTLSEKHPLTIFIRRLDMATNRVNIKLGQRKHSPAAAGRKIISSRLASAVTNPQARIFKRKIQTGDAGTILIDASGSMAIRDDELQAFVAAAPALTVAFYNAPDDDSKKGNIFIYAANGYRAHSVDIASLRYAFDFGSGNVIDYHAMAWLIKQPGPRYIITDKAWTGRWASASESLCRKLEDSKQIQVVRDINHMQKILNDRTRR